MNRSTLLTCSALSAVLVIVLGTYLYHRFSDGTGKYAQAPRVMLWAWERPERLKALTNPNVGVAFLSETIHLKQGHFVVSPRMQPLFVNPQTYLEAVVRIEDDRGLTWKPSDEELSQLASTIASTTLLPGVKSLQIDFDARESERPYYKHLLASVKEKLPKDKPLSMTALASWCLGDKWISAGLVDQVVPMLFSMGIGKQDAFNFIATSRQQELAYFEKAVGLSINDNTTFELLTKKANMNNCRVYFFSGHAWNPDTIRRAQGEVHKWLTASAI